MTPSTNPASLTGPELRLTVIVSRFNTVVTERLLAGALSGLRHHGVSESSVDVVHVPGAFELPFTVDIVARSRHLDGMVCLGAVVRGETPHFDIIATWTVAEIGRLSLLHRLPVALGVLTTNTIEQALDRAGGAHGNRGYDAALVAIEMAILARQFESRTGGP